MGKKTTALIVATFAIVFMGALTSQVNTYVNGQVLTASQLNSEFGNIYSTINNLDQANLSASTVIPASKISATIDGDGLTRNGSTGALSVSPDNSTVEISSDQVRVKDLGVTTAKLAANAVTTVKITDANVTLAKMAADSVDTTKIVDATIATADLAAGAVTKVKQVVKSAASSTALVGDVALSSSNGSQTGLTGTGNFANLTVTITTNGGPVYLALVPVNAISTLSYLLATSGRTDYQFKRAGVILCNHSVTSADRIPVGGITFIDTPAAGTYVYTAAYSVFSGTGTLVNARLVAYEL